MTFYYYILFVVCIFSSVVSSKETLKSSCLEKEKAITLLETAENLLLKATKYYPSCDDNLNSTEQEDCANKKPLAYIEVSKKLISDVRKNFPSCLKPIIDNNNDTIDDNVDDNGDNDDGKIKIEKPKDCRDILANNRTKSGVYTIWLQEPDSDEKQLQVYCDMDTIGGGWTVIQRRGNFPVLQDFYQDWETYKNGFGNLKQEFWLGNENIRLLCRDGCKIRFDLQDHLKVQRYAFYENFVLSSNYTIHISGYSGNATDAIGHHNGYGFSTKDRDYNGKAVEYRSGWWHGKEYYCNLNGIYQPEANGQKYVYWWKKPNDYDNLISAEMKIQPK